MADPLPLQREVLAGIEGAMWGRTAQDNLTLRGRGLIDHKGVVIYINDTAYTLQPRDSGGLIICTQACTITLPPNMDVGFACLIGQYGAGAVNFTVPSPAALHNRRNHTGLAGRFAEASFQVWANVDGLSAEYVMAGDTA